MPPCGAGKGESTRGSREAEVHGANPGICMQADPKVEEIHRQEYYEGEAMDMGTVLSLDESATVPYGFFDHLLMTKDWNPRPRSRGRAQVLRSGHRKFPRAACRGSAREGRADRRENRMTEPSVDTRKVCDKR
jgi:hypothetical protein